MPLSNKRLQRIQPTVVRTQPKTITRTINNAPKPLDKKSTHGNANIFGKIEPIWENQTVYLIGGGPSLKGFDWSRLDGKHVIAINRAFEVIPSAEVLYWTDSRFYKWYKDGIDKFKGLKFTCRPITDNPGNITILKPNSSVSIDMRPDHISSGNNSGFGAINLAIKLGAKRIYLLGFDMTSKENETHWHSGYSVTHNHSIYSKMQSQLSMLPEQLKKMEIEVYNANPKSNLTVFRRVLLDAAILDNPVIPGLKG